MQENCQFFLFLIRRGEKKYGVQPVGAVEGEEKENESVKYKFNFRPHGCATS